jgi:hypothetical protein
MRGTWSVVREAGTWRGTFVARTGGPLVHRYVEGGSRGRARENVRADAAAQCRRRSRACGRVAGDLVNGGLLRELAGQCLRLCCF